MIDWPLIYSKKGEHPWVTYAKQLIYKKNSCMNLAMIGQPGSGKSWGLLSYFSQIDPDFNLDEQLCFRADKLLKIINPNSPKLIKGKPFMFDESGIDLYNLNWRDEINTGINMFFQTERSLNYIFGMTVPYLSFISAPVRKLLTHEMTAIGWTKDNKTKAKAFRLEWNDEKKKFYRKKLAIYHKDIKRTNFCKNIQFGKPPMSLVREYEKRKREFQKEIHEEIQKGMYNKKMKEKKANLIKCNDFAKELGISNQTMLNRIKDGNIKGDKIGDIWYMTKKEREKHLNRPNLLETE